MNENNEGFQPPEGFHKVGNGSYEKQLDHTEAGSNLTPEQFAAFQKVEALVQELVDVTKDHQIGLAIGVAYRNNEFEDEDRIDCSVQLEVVGWNDLVEIAAFKIKEKVDGSTLRGGGEDALMQAILGGLGQ